ncbi:MAG: S4 domain-containing protein [Hungatella sp.]
MPSHQLCADDFNEGVIDILAVLQKSGLAPSRAEARRNVEQGGVSVNGEQAKDIKKTYTAEDFGGDGMVVKRGKKNFMKVTV